MRECPKCGKPALTYRDKMCVECSINVLISSVKEENETYIYIIINPAWPNHVKIGKTKNIRKRLSAYQTGSPYKDYKVYYNKPAKDADEIEEYFNEMFPNSVNEWYEVDKDKAVSIIEILTAKQS